MMRQSSGRNHRSRGWKVKHVLQICLLVAVCVWLLYQVKHSHDKKKALEEGNLKVLDKVEESRPEFLKLGRKDPQGNSVVTATDSTAHSEEEEIEEPEEAAEQENKQEENEEEDGKGGGDDEIDESDQERGDDEADGGEEFGDEEDKQRRTGDAGLLENVDREDDEGKSQDAREEHYKADDASSAVVRDTQEVAQENGEIGAGNLDEEQRDNVEKEELENDGRNNGTEVDSKADEMHDVPTYSEDQLNSTNSLNDTAVREREAEVESLQNSTVVIESTSHVEEHSSITSNSSEHLEQHGNSTTIFEPNNQNEQQSNSTEAVPDEQKEAQNVSTVNNGDNGDSTPEDGTANVDSVQDQSRVNETITLAEENAVSENALLEEAQKSNLTEAVEESVENHSRSSITDDNRDAMQGEATDSSGDESTITEEDQEARADLSTLPDVEIERREEEDIAAE